MAEPVNAPRARRRTRVLAAGATTLLAAAATSRATRLARLAALSDAWPGYAGDGAYRNA